MWYAPISTNALLLKTEIFQLCILRTCVHLVIVYEYYAYYSAGCEDGEVRLQGGTDPSNGRVEVCQFRAWGGVCNDEWDDNDARVVCGQLEYQPEGMYGHDCIRL